MIPWIKHFARIIGSSIVLVFMIIVVMFVLLELSPGDPIQALMGDAPVSEAYRQQMTETFGLDQPAIIRFFTYVANVASGNLGYSFANNMPVLELIIGRLGNTLMLAIPSIILSSVGGIFLGAIAARTRSKFKDSAISIGAVIGFSIPTFWMGLLMILLFSVTLGWLPAQGMNSFANPGFSWRHLVLPLAAMTLTELAFKTRIMRSSMIEVLGQDYIDTARSKGLTSREILRRHGILNSMLPMVSVIGYSLGYTIAGAVVIEKVFGWPGMGLLLFDAIQKSENMVILGVLLIMTITVVIVNILTDVVYGLVDPRIGRRFKLEREA